jgi:lysophospholipase L1-like esterase
VRGLFPGLLLAFSFAAFLSAQTHAGQPAVHRVSELPAVTPLAASTGGRMLTLPSTATGFGGKDYIHQWPGAYFRAAFAGTRVFFRIVRGDETLHIVVDEQPAMKLIKPEAGMYEVDGLEEGKHAIGIFVASEDMGAPNRFGGFAIPADDKALRLPPRRRQMEFIGDSHTVGYGDLSSKRECTKDEVRAGTDNTKAFGAMTAVHYDADYQVNAISGRGVVRNYGGWIGDTVPQLYPYVLFYAKQKYMDPAWKPEVIVIGLGTNDFSTPLNPGERWKTRDELYADYEATYLRFLQKLRARNPNAYFVIWATDIGGGEIEAEAQKVVQQLIKSGDNNVTFLPVDGLSFGGCDWHPSLADQKIISDKLIQLIDAAEQAWPSR